MNQSDYKYEIYSYTGSRYITLIYKYMNQLLKKKQLLKYKYVDNKQLELIVIY